MNLPVSIAVQLLVKRWASYNQESIIIVKEFTTRQGSTKAGMPRTVWSFSTAPPPLLVQQSTVTIYLLFSGSSLVGVETSLTVTSNSESL